MPFRDKEGEDNPYLPQLREIIEQILEKKGISYRDFSPILVDGADSCDCLQAAKLLSGGLNRILILTDNPAYFEAYADNMYEEQGLIAEIFPKNAARLAKISTDAIRGNVIFDFEKKTDGAHDLNFGKKIYIPVFKRRWEEAGNLDIAIPIGYNTMIVRGGRPALHLDRLERAFYENE